MFVWEFDRLQADLICKHCGVKGLLEKYEKKPHIGTRCKSCDAWNEWLKQSVPNPYALAEKYIPQEKPEQEWGTPPDKERQPRYTPNQIAHPQTLEERVASLEHDLGIIAQIVMGKRNG